MINAVKNDDPSIAFCEVVSRLQVGDVVFISSLPLPFRKVAEATNSWTNHVGIVIATDGKEPIIGESTFPFSKATPISRFIARSAGRKIAVRRLIAPLSEDQKHKIKAAAERRFNTFYDTGFDLRSRRQFCSRFVHEVIQEATSIHIGEVEDFASLLARNPDASLGFWKVWYFGNIPWQRETITPASLFESPLLFSLLEGLID